MSQKLTIAVPSKGRIMEGVFEFFADAGLPIKKSGGDREYTGRVKGLEGADVLFMSSSEIAGALASGQVHIGVTGEDLMREKSADFEGSISLIKALGFGGANVVVAVPASWIDVRTMSDLKDVAQDFRARHGRPIRVATKYIETTSQFFAENGLVDYRIVESAGATEGAPAAGTAELIVDITSTGSTLAANNLKILDDGIILRSEAQLAASLKAKWTKGARTALTHILDMVAAKDQADSTYIVRFQWQKPKDSEAFESKLAEAYDCVFSAHPKADARWPGDYSLQCPTANLYAVVEELRGAGAANIIARRADYIFTSDNHLLAGLREKLSGF